MSIQFETSVCRFQEGGGGMRKIIHLDMDAFYASIEERDHPELRGKPVIVGAPPGTRGVVSTCNYKAREFGVRSAMSSAEAYRRCPQAIFVPCHFSRYQEASRQVHAIMEAYTDCIEFLSLDEGYMDVTGSERFFGKAEDIALAIQKEVFQTVGTTCSVGVGYNMLSAKLASEEKKPRGFFVIDSPAAFCALMAERPVGILYGVGAKTEERLCRLGIRTVAELANADPLCLSSLGNMAADLQNYARGIDHRQVTPNAPPKSIGKETTFPTDVTDMQILQDTLLLLSRMVSDRLLAAGLKCRTVTLKVKYGDLRSVTRSRSAESICGAEAIYHTAEELLRQLGNARPVRLIGVSVGNLTEGECRQLCFDEDVEESSKEEEKMVNLVHTLRTTYGKGKLKTAKELLAEQHLRDLQNKR